MRLIGFYFLPAIATDLLIAAFCYRPSIPVNCDKNEATVDFFLASNAKRLFGIGGFSEVWIELIGCFHVHILNHPALNWKQNINYNSLYDLVWIARRK